MDSENERKNAETLKRVKDNILSRPSSGSGAWPSAVSQASKSGMSGKELGNVKAVPHGRKSVRDKQLDSVRKLLASPENQGSCKGVSTSGLSDSEVSEGMPVTGQKSEVLMSHKIPAPVKGLKGHKIPEPINLDDYMAVDAGQFEKDMFSSGKGDGDISGVRYHLVIDGDYLSVQMAVKPDRDKVASDAAMYSVEAGQGLDAMLSGLRAGSCHETFVAAMPSGVIDGSDIMSAGGQGDKNKSFSAASPGLRPGEPAAMMPAEDAMSKVTGSQVEDLLNRYHVRMRSKAGHVTMPVISLKARQETGSERLRPEARPNDKSKMRQGPVRPGASPVSMPEVRPAMANAHQSGKRRDISDRPMVKVLALIRGVLVAVGMLRDTVIRPARAPEGMDTYMEPNYLSSNERFDDSDVDKIIMSGSDAAESVKRALEVPVLPEPVHDSQDAAGLRQLRRMSMDKAVEGLDMSQEATKELFDREGPGAFAGGSGAGAGEDEYNDDDEDAEDKNGKERARPER